jgi:hypothetical protein
MLVETNEALPSETYLHDVTVGFHLGEQPVDLRFRPVRAGDDLRLLKSAVVVREETCHHVVVEQLLREVFEFGRPGSVAAPGTGADVSCDGRRREPAETLVERGWLRGFVDIARSDPPWPGVWGCFVWFQACSGQSSKYFPNVDLYS